MSNKQWDKATLTAKDLKPKYRNLTNKSELIEVLKEAAPDLTEPVIELWAHCFIDKNPMLKDFLLTYTKVTPKFNKIEMEISVKKPAWKEEKNEAKIDKKTSKKNAEQNA